MDYGDTANGFIGCVFDADRFCGRHRAGRGDLTRTMQCLREVVRKSSRDEYLYRHIENLIPRRKDLCWGFKIFSKN